MTCFGFVEAERAQFPVSLLCRVVGVTRQGYYAWKRRGPSDRELADIDLAVRIRRVHEQTEGIYGAPRIQTELRLAARASVLGKLRGRQVDAPARPQRRRRTRRRAMHHDPRGRALFGTRARRQRLHARRAQPALGVRNQVRPDRARLHSGWSACNHAFSCRRIIGCQCASTSKQSSSSTRSAWQPARRETASRHRALRSRLPIYETVTSYGSHAKESGIDLWHDQLSPTPGTTRSRARHSAAIRLERTPQTRTLHHTRARKHAHLLIHRMLLQCPPTQLQPRHAQRPINYAQRHQTKRHRGPTYPLDASTGNTSSDAHPSLYTPV